MANQFEQNELYITPSWDFNPLASINGKASINSPAEYLKKHPSGNITRSSRGHGKTFICRRGCNTRTATYTDEFIWEDIFDGSELAIHNLIQRVKSETKATRKRRFPQHKLDTDTEFMGPMHNDEILATPRKKQKTSTLVTPRKLKTPSKLTTPSHKRSVTNFEEYHNISNTALQSCYQEASRVHSSCNKSAVAKSCSSISISDSKIEITRLISSSISTMSRGRIHGSIFPFRGSYYRWLRSLYLYFRNTWYRKNSDGPRSSISDECCRRC